ncbi:MAG TPA: SCO family protein [Pyrinomonadaceae bacterium]|nr:SCO family protein [Pyrinomonadaceae bacterium]
MKHLYSKTQSALLKGMSLGLLVCTLAFSSAQAQHDGHKTSPAKGTRQQTKTKDNVHYSCPMHASVKAKKPGKCPKCGMDLRADRNEETAATTANEPTSDQLSKVNIPDIELLDQNGRKIHFYTDLVKGQTVAINFIFTTCTTICPPLGATFARVQKELGDKVGRDVRFISISVDPVTDTPERLKAWGAKFHAGDGWTFVTGSKPQVDELLRALGASSARREDHSPTVLIGNDASGNWTRTYGLAKSSQLVQIINDAIAGKITTTTAGISN